MTLSPLDKAARMLEKAATAEEAIAVQGMAEAARAWARRVNLGLDAQNSAALIKFKAQRKSSELLDELERANVGRRNASQVVTHSSEYAETLERANLSREEVRRWRQVREVFTEDELEAKAARASATDEELTRAFLFKLSHVSHNSGHVEWYTPVEYVDAARKVMGGIDLDPASDAEANKVIGAERFYDEDDDGLAQEWAGRVWMNPPYASGVIDKFATKLRDSYVADTVTEAVTVVNNATETAWFHTLGRVANAFCFPSGRISFWRPDRDSITPLQGQAFMYFGEHVAEFRSVFGAFGITVTP